MWIPKTMPTEASIIGTGKRISDLTTDGVIYGYWGDTAYKSSDWALIWNVIATNLDGAATIISHVKKLASGRVLIVLSNGKIYLSDTAETNFALVKDLGATVREIEFGISIYGDIIAISSYTNSPIIASVSLDGGITWADAITGATFGDLATTLNHIHAFVYDPYQNLLWVSTGDGPPFSVFEPGVEDRIGWSDNWGISWNWLDPETYCRVTSIIPLPNCLLFGSDEYGFMGIYRVDRPTMGIHDKIVPKLVWQYRSFLESNPQSANYMNWCTYPAIRYGENACAYFGFYEGEAFYNIPAAVIWGTKDGHRFWPVWVDKRAPVQSGQVGALMVKGVFGPTTAGYLVASTQRWGVTPLDAAVEIIKFKDPEWIWIDMETN